MLTDTPTRIIKINANKNTPELTEIYIGNVEQQQ